MSLSTQLTRGTLALPMLALFGALALVAGQAADAQAMPPQARSSSQASATVTRVELARDTVVVVRSNESGNCAGHGRPQLQLARAPADLGPIAQRLGACRA